MQANTTVIECLEESLSLHWQAVQNYKLQQHHFDRLGYSKLASKFKADVEEELGHLDKLVNRLEQFDVVPETDHYFPDFPRMPDIKGIMEANLNLEKASRDAERACITTARSSGDELTANLVAENLEGSEDSIVEIEADLRQLEAVGVDNWLADKL